MTTRSPLKNRKALLLSILLTCFILPEIHAQNAKTEILSTLTAFRIYYAKNAKEMYYAFGWAQMNNHANLLLRVYGQARGRAAHTGAVSI